MNDLVTLHDETLARLTWRKEIVVELLKGPDEKIRGPKTRTSNRSILKQPVTKLFQLFSISSNGQECWCEYEREWWGECEQENVQ